MSNRKSLWIVPSLLLFVAIAAPLAHADGLVTYTVTEGVIGSFTGFATTQTFGPEQLTLNPDMAWTTAPMSPVTSQTTIPASALTSIAFGGSLSDLTISDVSGVTFDVGASPLNESGTVDTAFVVGGQPSGAAVDGPWDNTQYMTPGTYVDANGLIFSTLTVTAVPEPATCSLMLIGIGLLGLLMRKRLLRDFPRSVDRFPIYR